MTNSDATTIGLFRVAAGLQGQEVGNRLLGCSVLPRDLPNLNSVLDGLDRYSLATHRPVTLPLVREALERRSESFAWPAGIKG